MRKQSLTTFGISTGILVLSIFATLSSISDTHATTSAGVTDEFSLIVPVSCTMASTVNTEHTTAIQVGTYREGIGETTFNVICNDSNGFAIYAIGYSDNSFGNTTMKPTNSTNIADAIVTGTATSGDTSNWAMKLTAVTGDYAPTLEAGFNAYHAVPAEYTKVATFASNTDDSIGSSIKSTYATFISSAQVADTYVGKVKYTVIHPANGTTPIAPVATMQNMDASVCTTTPKYVIDNRDEHIYTIQRLKDGKCWMMENLDLGRTELTTNLTSANTNLETTVTSSTFNSWKKTSGTATYNAGELISVDGIDSTSGTPYGTLYNYYAVSAGTVSGSPYNSDATHDICPSGWRLPTDKNSGEFQALYAQYNSNALMRASVENDGAAFALPGRFYDSEVVQTGDYGAYWSSTSRDATHFNLTRVNLTNVYTGNIDTRSYGNAVRCILNEPPKTISSLSYLQDFSNLSANDKTTVLNSMSYNTTYNLVDSRDNKTYKVAKLKDNNIWMAENLDLGRTALTTDLTSSNTNISTTITASTFNSWIKTIGTESWTTPELVSLSASNTRTGLDNDPTSLIPYGTSYNYCAASAGTVCVQHYYNDAEYDLCPAGWRLPIEDITGGGEFNALYNIADYNSSSSMRAPIADGGAAFALSGYMGTVIGEQGVYGFYWSSSVGDMSSYMCGLYIDDSYVGAPNVNNRLHGASIRCIAK